jgi:hypothetical protein
VFANHKIIQVPVLDGSPVAGNQYFDPSYGMTYANEADFESKAVAGCAWKFFSDPGTNFYHIYHVFIPVPGSPDILFSFLGSI